MPPYYDLIKRAKRLYEHGDMDFALSGQFHVEIENEAAVKPQKAGALVQAWVWVPYEDEEIDV